MLSSDRPRQTVLDVFRIGPYLRPLYPMIAFMDIINDLTRYDRLVANDPWSADRSMDDVIHEQSRDAVPAFTLPDSNRSPRMETRKSKFARHTRPDTRHVRKK
jgi:hypothetical protein